MSSPRIPFKIGRRARELLSSENFVEGFSFFKFDGERRDFLKLTIFHDRSRRDSNYLSQKIYIYICMYNREE